MSRSLKQARVYSRKVLPPLWRTIAIADDISLQYLGKANLEKMLEEWHILIRAYELKVKYYRENDNLSGAAEKLKFAEEGLKNAQFALSKIPELLSDAEEKPIFASHRPLTDYFIKGEKAFTVVIEDGFFTPVTILSQELDRIVVRFDVYADETTGSIEYNSPLILKTGDLLYLANDLDYARMFACGSDLNYQEDIELFLAMLEDFAQMYLDSGSEKDISVSDNA